MGKAAAAVLMHFDFGLVQRLADTHETCAARIRPSGLLLRSGQAL